MSEQTPPSAPDIERAVIGELILEPQHIGLVHEAGDNLFYKPPYALIFRALDHLNIEGSPIDQLTVTEQLRSMNALEQVGGEVSVAAIINESPSAANIAAHIAILKEKALLRRILMLSVDMRQKCFETGAGADNIVGHALDAIRELREQYGIKKNSLADEVREFVNSSEFTFSSSDVIKYLGYSSKVTTKPISNILGRLVREGMIERTGGRHGFYRRVMDDCDTIDFFNATEAVLDIRWPMGLERYVETMPGNIIVVAGEQNAGKTAFLLNFVKLNMRRHDVWYFNSEMGASELKKRLRKFDDIALDCWRFQARERSSNFHDVLRPDGVNIVDFLEIHEDFWKVGGMLKKIHDRLGKGIAVVAVQKSRESDYGRGGSMGMEKPRIYLSIKPGELTIVKGKNWAVENDNPNGRKIPFKLVQGARFIEQSTAVQGA